MPLTTPLTPSPKRQVLPPGAAQRQLPPPGQGRHIWPGRHAVRAGHWSGDAQGRARVPAAPPGQAGAAATRVAAVPGPAQGGRCCCCCSGQPASLLLCMRACMLLASPQYPWPACKDMRADSDVHIAPAAVHRKLVSACVYTHASASYSSMASDMCPCLLPASPQSLMHEDPAQRPTAEALLKSPLASRAGLNLSSARSPVPPA
jgi:hypothetical protein